MCFNQRSLQEVGAVGGFGITLGLMLLLFPSWCSWDGHPFLVCGAAFMGSVGGLLIGEFVDARRKCDEIH